MWTTIKDCHGTGGSSEHVNSLMQVRLHHDGAEPKDEAGPRVMACVKVPKHLSGDTLRSLRRDDNEDTPQWKNPNQLINSLKIIVYNAIYIRKNNLGPKKSN